MTSSMKSADDAPVRFGTLVTASGAEALPLQAKGAVAARILDRLEQFLVAVPAKNAPAKA